MPERPASAISILSAIKIIILPHEWGHLCTPFYQKPRHIILLSPSNKMLGSFQ